MRRACRLRPSLTARYEPISGGRQHDSHRARSRLGTNSTPRAIHCRPEWRSARWMRSMSQMPLRRRWWKCFQQRHAHIRAICQVGDRDHDPGGGAGHGAQRHRRAASRQLSAARCRPHGIGGAAGSDTIYYRSAANTWSPVTIGANLTFSAARSPQRVAAPPAPPTSASTAAGWNISAPPHCQFLPYNGDRIRINGTIYAIPLGRHRRGGQHKCFK